MDELHMGWPECLGFSVWGTDLCDNKTSVNSQSFIRFLYNTYTQNTHNPASPSNCGCHAKHGEQFEFMGLDLPCSVSQLLVTCVRLLFGAHRREDSWFHSHNHSRKKPDHVWVCSRMFYTEVHTCMHTSIHPYMIIYHPSAVHTQIHTSIHRPRLICVHVVLVQCMTFEVENPKSFSDTLCLASLCFLGAVC